MSKIQCYHCHKFGHCRDQCLERSNDRKKIGRQHAPIIDIDQHTKKAKF